MNRRDDDPDVPTHRLSDRAVDDLIAGRPVAGQADLTAAVLRIAATAHGPAPAPSAALAAVLAGGLVPAPVVPARGSAGRRWAARAVAGASALALALTGAATAQALPGPVQGAVSDAVRTLTPFELPGDDDLDPGEQRAPLPRPAPTTPAEQPAAGGADGSPTDDEPVTEDADERGPVAEDVDEGRPEGLRSDSDDADDDAGDDGAEPVVRTPQREADEQGPSDRPAVDQEETGGADTEETDSAGQDDEAARPGGDESD